MKADMPSERGLSGVEKAFLQMLAGRSGVIFVRGQEEELARRLATGPLIATGWASGGAIAVQITEAGRSALKGTDHG